MKKRILFFVLSCLFLGTNFVYSQVGVNTEAPYKLTDLQIKNIVNGTDTVPKGIMIPRMTELQRDAIVIDNETDANSLMVYNVDEDCYNYYSKEAGEWQSLCGKVGKAQIDSLYCSEIKYYGNYIKGVQVTMSEYIVIPVEVTKAGQYTMTVNAKFNSTTSNGYSFTGSGEFLYTGKQYVTLTAQGIPTEEHYDAADPTVGDELEYFFNGMNIDEYQCDNIVIPVTGALAEYNVRCGTAKVYGIYTVLPDRTNSDDESHYIEIQVDVTNTNGNTTTGWSATTNTVNGLAFRGAGKFANEGERQLIRLYAVEGSRANTYDPIVLTVTFETMTGPTSCNVTVRPAYTRKRIAAFSLSSGWGYGGNNGGSKAFLTNNLNFGDNENSVVKMVTKSTTTLPSGYEDYNAFEYRRFGSGSISAADFRAAVATNPDIIILGFDGHWSAAAASLALDYLNKGGIIFEFSESGTVENMLAAVFGTTTASITRPTTTPAITLLAGLSDPLIEGPFQPTINGEKKTSLGGLYLGGDTENRLYCISGLPSSGIITYGYGAGGSSNPAVFRVIGKRYVYFGDAGFLTNNHDGTYASNIEPFGVTSTGIPEMRPIRSSGDVYYGGQNGGPATTGGLANSFFFGNMMAWAIEEAQFHGYNAQ